MVAGGCEGEQRVRDASAPPSLQTAEVSVRFDVAPQKSPVMSVLAFQAAVSGVAQRDVLGIVDPLAAAAPERDCELRDLDLSANALVARGGSIELQELGGIGIALGSSNPASSAIVRPFPRLFPDVATVVGGIVAEAGPLPLAGLPERVGLLTPASELPLEELAVPAAPHIAGVNGAPLTAGAKLDAHDGLSITVSGGLSGGAGTVVELRPFGATVAIACALPEAVGGITGGDSTLVIPRALIARLSGGTSAPAGTIVTAIPASLDVLSRAHVRVAPFATSSRLSIEVRASTAVEIRP
jgi:hypothetical protein